MSVPAHTQTVNDSPPVQYLDAFVATQDINENTRVSEFFSGHR
jgi:hypothetical protein